jgi:hypothetical protein
MAEEPENFVLHYLPDIRTDVASLRTEVKDTRGDVHEIRTVLDSHTLRFDFLEERVEMLREGTLTAIGFATSDLAMRVEKVETA